MTDFDLKSHLRGFTERTYAMLVNDLKAVPVKAQNVGVSGIGRSPLNIVAECAATNGMIAKFLSGVEAQRPAPEERAKLLASFDTAEKALAYLESETNTLYAAIDGLDVATLSEMSDKPFGRPMSKFAIAEVPALHMFYHDGQLNYIQSLLGDTEMHW